MQWRLSLARTISNLFLKKVHTTRKPLHSNPHRAQIYNERGIYRNRHLRVPTYVLTHTFEVCTIDMEETLETMALSREREIGARVTPTEIAGKQFVEYGYRCASPGCEFVIWAMRELAAAHSGFCSHCSVPVKRNPKGISNTDGLAVNDSISRKLSPVGEWLYEFLCTEPECFKSFFVKRGEIEQHSGLCSSHMARAASLRSTRSGGGLSPIQLYYIIKAADARLKAERNTMGEMISFSQFERLTKIKNCTYCTSDVPWFTSGAYHLDRLNNQQGYTLGNVVVCCTLCNLIRGDRLTPDEMKQLGPSVRAIADKRKAAQGGR